MVVADQGFIQQRFGSDPDEYHCRLESFPSVRVVSIADSGHNVQHDQPKYLATLLEEFFGRD
jgi:pimeloyl-ACP methyl ester carboxylesterase